jgi:hypothetical protein
MSRSRNNPLLSDVLGEGSDADFREALLDDMLHMARRKRRFRKARHVAYTSLMIAVLALVSFHFLVSKPSPSKRFEPPYLLVTTRQFPANAILSTTQGHSIAFISSSATIELVTTSQSLPVLRELDDDQLLALLPSPALLVRRGPHLAELVFADPNAQHALSPN